MGISVLDIVNMMRKRGRGDPPSALADIFVNPLSRISSFLSDKIDFARTEQTLDSILALIEDTTTLNSLATDLGEDVASLTLKLTNCIDDVASNFGLTRRPAAQSRGSVLLLRASDPQNVLPITVPMGRIMSAPSLNQDYRVSTTVIITSMAYDAARAMFVSSIPVESVAVGIATIAAAEEISKIVDVIVGIDGVANSDPVTGGRDIESDRELVARVKTSLSANNIGTKSGYTNLILSLDNVKGVTVVGAGDPLMTRDLGDGGSIDIYVTDPIPTIINETAIPAQVDGAGPYYFIPSRQPIINDVNTVSPPPTAIVQDTSVYGGSIKGKDKIQYSSDPTGLIIQYQTNGLIEQVDEFIKDASRMVLGADILIKEAETVLVDVIGTLVVLSGYSGSLVKTNVENAINQHISILTIGESLDQSDIIKIVAEIAGVDRIKLPLQKFDVSSGSSVLDIIEPLANQVLRSGTITTSL
jgi:uncharacterized phage protein gp47/JayE